MNKEIRAKIFGLYLPGKWIELDTDGEPLINEMDGSFYVNENTYSFVHGIYMGTACPAKLLLTPISEITDEDLKEVWLMLGKNPDFEEEGFSIREYLMEYLLNSDKKPAKIELFDFVESVAIIDFLRSRGYMLPYNGIDLFEAGIAKRKEG